MLKEFKDFVLRGNVLDLAVGVIIGAAFTALVKSLVDNLINPLIGMFVQSTALAHLSVTIGKTKFTYGASADISLGLKLCNTSKGNSTFLHVGYAVIASEFETKGMFKGGYIMVGLTTILK